MEKRNLTQEDLVKRLCSRICNRVNYNIAKSLEVKKAEGEDDDEMEDDEGPILGKTRSGKDVMRDEIKDTDYSGSDYRDAYWFYRLAGTRCLNKMYMEKEKDEKHEMVDKSHELMEKSKRCVEKIAAKEGWEEAVKRYSTDWQKAQDHAYGYDNLVAIGE